MKTIVSCILMFLSVSSIAQTTLSGNGGQSATNSMATLNYVGYQNGKYLVSLTGKTSCTLSYNINWLGKDTTVTVAGMNSITIYQLPGAAKANTEIKAKPLSSCNNSGDMGWLEIWSPTALPIHFISYKATKVKKIR